MRKEIVLRNRKIIYTLRKSKRAKRMRLAVYCDGSVVLTVPSGLRQNIIEEFISEKSLWVFSKINSFKRKIIFKKDYSKYKEKARILANNKASYFAGIFGYKYNKINIKNQKTRWGSCSKKGNLNFNYKILFLPEKIQDYIIVHEICHLKEFNHSRDFWRLVSSVIPDYVDIRKELKHNSL